MFCLLIFLVFLFAFMNSKETFISPWKTGITRSSYPFGGYYGDYSKYGGYRGSYLDLNYPSKKYALPQWYSRVTLAQQGLLGIKPYYYHNIYY